MKIKSLKIENFKTLSLIELELNPSLNIFTGVNNSGKTTILEAIALWTECFRKVIRKAGKASTAKGLKQGQWWFGREHNYSESSDIKSVRSPRYEDIFHGLDTDSTILLEARVGPNDGSAPDITIGFTIRAGRGRIYDIILRNWDSFDHAAFNDLFRAFPDPINIVYASPVAFLPAAEEFETIPKIKARIQSRESIRILRNRLHQLRKAAPRYGDFLLRVSYVLNENALPIEFHVDGDETQDVEISVKVQIGPKDTPKDISVLGSGTLQIIEILLAIHEIMPGLGNAPKDLSLVLLDEPDSHIHRDIQKRLLATLQEQGSNCQVFLTTHNESFIRSADPTHVFHLEPDRKGLYRPIATDDSVAKRIGLQPSRQINALTALGGESALDFLNALEAEHLILVEGEDDARYIQAMVERQFSPRRTFRAMYWSFNGLDSLLSQILTYRQVFSLFKNKKSLWDKATIVIDADHLMDAQRTKLQEELTKKLARPVFCWSAYTIESTVLSDPSKLPGLVRDLIRTEKLAATIPPEPAIAEAASASLEALRKRLLERLDTTRFCEQVVGQLVQRRKNLERLDLDKIIGDDKFLWKNYHDYARSALNSGKVEHMSTKDDVLDVFRGIFSALELSLDETNLFLRLIEVANLSTRAEEWGVLSKKLHASA